MRALTPGPGAGLVDSLDAVLGQAESARRFSETSQDAEALRRAADGRDDIRNFDAALSTEEKDGLIAGRRATLHS